MIELARIEKGQSMTPTSLNMNQASSSSTQATSSSPTSSARSYNNENYQGIVPTNNCPLDLPLNVSTLLNTTITPITQPILPSSQIDQAPGTSSSVDKPNSSPRIIVSEPADSSPQQRVPITPSKMCQDQFTFSSPSTIKAVNQNYSAQTPSDQDKSQFTFSTPPTLTAKILTSDDTPYPIHIVDVHEESMPSPPPPYIKKNPVPLPDNIRQCARKKLKDNTMASPPMTRARSRSTSHDSRSTSHDSTASVENKTVKKKKGGKGGKVKSSTHV